MRRVTFSRNFTLSLSRTCRCYCKYCAFATHRAHLYAPEEVEKLLDEPLPMGEDDYLPTELERLRYRVLGFFRRERLNGVIAVNPGTPIPMVEPLLDDLELLLVLGVNPGWGGQRFIPATFAKLAAARQLIDGRPIVLGVDGGITRENVGAVASSGVDLIVTGSAVFDGVAPEENARFMLDAARTAGNQSAALAGAGPKEER